VRIEVPLKLEGQAPPDLIKASDHQRATEQTLKPLPDG
jgi:hypothetical protein